MDDKEKSIPGGEPLDAEPIETGDAADIDENPAASEAAADAVSEAAASDAETAAEIEADAEAAEEAEAAAESGSEAAEGDAPDDGEALGIAEVTELDGADRGAKEKKRSGRAHKHDKTARKAADDGAEKAVGDEPVSKKKRLVFALLAMLPALVCVFIISLSAHVNALSFGGNQRTILLLSLLILALSALLGVLRPRLPKAFGWVLWALSPAAIMLLSEWIRRDPFENFSTALILFNILVYYIAAALVLFLTRNTFVSTVAASVFPLLLAVANHYVQLFRGTVLFPWDLQSVGIAMTVVDNYEFDFPVVMAFCFLCFILIWQVSYFARVKILRSKKKMIVSFVCAALCLAAGFGYIKYVQSDRFESDFSKSGKSNPSFFDPSFYPYLFTPNTVYNRDGMMVSVIYALKFMNVEKPDGYSPEAVAAISAEYADADTGIEEAKVKPNIIVIMNEAWSDITAIAPFETNLEVFPVTSKLTENVVRGNMYMSVNGGNTANSEFEFLTSSSMAFLPPGSVPYQVFIKHETPNFVTSLKDQGYQAIAMHPYNAAGWDRNKVYPWFGFDAMYFSDSFPKDVARIRSYISDRAMFEKIESLYEDREKDKPFFLFGVTMQNHGGYTGHFDNFDQSVTVKGLESRATLSQYLSLIRETDFAFGELLEYFSAVDEPTLILMFGDHQPGEFVTAPLYANAGLTYPPEKFEDQQNKFIVPFILWANYDIEEKTDVLTSANYLSILLCEKAGLKLTVYQKFLSELREKYPVITANFYIDGDGAMHLNDDMDDIPALNEYRMIQYNQIIDWKNRYDDIFRITK